MFKRRMDDHKVKKRNDLQNELMKHVDLISDPKMKEYILKKKSQKMAAKESRQSKRKADIIMDSDGSEIQEEELEKKQKEK